MTEAGATSRDVAIDVQRSHTTVLRAAERPTENRYDISGQNGFTFGSDVRERVLTLFLLDPAASDSEICSRYADTFDGPPPSRRTISRWLTVYAPRLPLVKVPLQKPGDA